MAAATSARLTYTLGNALYVSLTNRCNAVSLIASRGPGFSVPASSGFEPLPDGFEPNGEQVAQAVLSAARLEQEGPSPCDVCFAGAGEPLLRLRTLEEAAALILQDSQPSMLRLRINTNGLIPRTEAADVARRLRKCGVRATSISLASSDPKQYAELMKPEAIRYSPGFSLQLGLQEVSGFVTECVTAGMKVECTTVQAPGVDIDAAQALATTLGASFRARSYFP